MKRRVRKIANFFAFNLLFFALYLNFIHKDKVASVDPGVQQPVFSGSVMVENPSDYLNQVSPTAAPANQQVKQATVAMK